MTANNFYLRPSCALISVIVPVYNVDKFLYVCLNSIKHQTYSNIEVILINDGSTDRSGDICKEFVKSDDRFILLEKKNGGLSSARNLGLEHAKGSFISFVDSDDVLNENFYSELISHYAKSGSEIVYTGYQYLYEHEVIPVKNIPSEIILTPSEFYPVMFSLKGCENLGVSGSHVWNKLFKRSVIGQTKFVEKKGTEDEIFLFEVLRNTKSIHFFPGCLYSYRQRSNSLWRDKEFKHDALECRFLIFDGADSDERKYFAKLAVLQLILNFYWQDLKQRKFYYRRNRKKFKRAFLFLFTPCILEYFNLKDIVKILILTTFPLLFSRILLLKNRIHRIIC